MSYGWKDFDPEVVEGIGARHPEHVVKQPGGGMTCPLVSHDEWLLWQDDNYAKGTVPHGEPPVAFRVSPTYILRNPLDNFIVGHDLVAAAINREWGKAETGRLGSENSEDAVSFNVFRSLQEAGALSLVAQLVTGSSTAEPDLYLWGRRINLDGTSSSWPELQSVRTKVEPKHRQQTEPDVCLHVPGWGWIFIEAKLAHGIKTSESAEKMDAWLALYPSHSPTLFDLGSIAEVEHSQFPEQILRNVVFADLIRADDELAHVVALGRGGDPTPINDWVSACLSFDCSVSISHLTWEEIYKALPSESEELSKLRDYFEQKSYRLRRAFALTD